jgi:hypothetical protein
MVALFYEVEKEQALTIDQAKSAQLAAISPEFK